MQVGKWVILATMVAFSVCALARTSHAKERPRVAVLQFAQAKTEFDEEDLKLLTDIARVKALEMLGGSYDVITRENLEDLLKSHGKSLASCQGECETETGRLLGAELVVSGRITKSFGNYKINIKVHRTDPPALLGADIATARRASDVEQVLKDAVGKVLASVPGVSRDRPLTKKELREAKKQAKIEAILGKRSSKKSRSSSRSSDRPGPPSRSASLSDLADQARVAAASEKELKAMWSELRKLARNKALPLEDRIAAVRDFLSQTPATSAYREPAEALLDRIEDTSYYHRRNAEYLMVGFGYAGVLEGGYGFFGTIGTNKWKHIYWRVIDFALLAVEPTYDGFSPEFLDDDARTGPRLGSGHLSTVVGVHHPISGDGRHDLRIGVGIGLLSINDAVKRDELLTTNEYDRDYLDWGLFPEVSYSWRLESGVAWELRLRFQKALASGDVSQVCESGGCPWGVETISTDEDGYNVVGVDAPDGGYTLHLAVGF